MNMVFESISSQIVKVRMREKKLVSKERRRVPGMGEMWAARMRTEKDEK